MKPKHTCTNGIIPTKYENKIVLNRNFSIYKVYPSLAPIQPIITAGGHSRRMGSPKALSLLDGVPLLAHIYEPLRQYFQCEPLVIANDPAILSAFPYTMLPDVHPGCGPLSALETAMLHSPTPYFYLTACDSPYLTPSFLTRLCLPLASTMNVVSAPASTSAPTSTSAYAGERWDAVVPLLDGQLEPLHALYHCRLLPRVQEALASGSYAVRRILPPLRTQFMPADPFRDTFYNVNTPEELAELEERWVFLRNKGL